MLPMLPQSLMLIGTALEYTVAWEACHCVHCGLSLCALLAVSPLDFVVCVHCLLCLEMVGGSRSAVGNGPDTGDWEV